MARRVHSVPGAIATMTSEGFAVATAEQSYGPTDLIAGKRCGASYSPMEPRRRTTCGRQPAANHAPAAGTAVNGFELDPGRLGDVSERVSVLETALGWPAAECD